MEAIGDDLPASHAASVNTLRIRFASLEQHHDDDSAREGRVGNGVSWGEKKKRLGGLEEG